MSIETRRRRPWGTPGKGHFGSGMREEALNFADSNGETIMEGAVRSTFSAGTPSFLPHCTPMNHNCVSFVALIDGV